MDDKAKSRNNFKLLSKNEYIYYLVDLDSHRNYKVLHSANKLSIKYNKQGEQYTHRFS